MEVYVCSGFEFWPSQANQIINVSSLPCYDIFRFRHLPRSCHSWLWQGAHGGCDQSTAGSYSSKAPDPTSIFLETCVALLWILISLNEFWDGEQFVIVIFIVHFGIFQIHIKFIKLHSIIYGLLRNRKVSVTNISASIYPKMVS